MAAPHWWWLPGVGSLESLAGRVAGYVFTNLCGLPAPAAHVRGARHKAQQRQTWRALRGCGLPLPLRRDRREKWRTGVFDVRKFMHWGELRRRRELGLAAPAARSTCVVCEGESINNDRPTLGACAGEC